MLLVPLMCLTLILTVMASRSDDFYDERAARMVHDYVERLSSLLQDGYAVVFEVKWPGLYHVKLRHARNFTIMTLSAHFANLTLIQRRNGMACHIASYS